MEILIIGGTKFVGRAIAETALARGHRLTVFHRGQTNPELFPAAEHLIGDRNQDLSALRGRRWGAVIDTSAYFPAQVERLLEFLQPNQDLPHYTLISSVSVYRDSLQPGIDEKYPTGMLPEGAAADVITNETYGPLKVLCEQTAQSALPGKTLIIRPGLIVGRYDPTDRFTYWPMRVQRGGQVLAPGKPERPVQWIDVRDLAEWTLRMVEARSIGVYNASGLPGAVSFEALLLTCKQVANTAARLTWVDDHFLLQHNVTPWTEMPVWIPESDPDAAGFFSINVNRAIQAGLTFRPLTDTIRSTLEWARTRPADYTWKAGLTTEREAELLAAWAGRA